MAVKLPSLVDQLALKSNKEEILSHTNSFGLCRESLGSYIKRTFCKALIQATKSCPSNNLWLIKCLHYKEWKLTTSHKCAIVYT